MIIIFLKIKLLAGKLYKIYYKAERAWQRSRWELSPLAPAPNWDP